MSKIEKLIAELCPDGVKYRPLVDVCVFLNGFAFKSSLFKPNGQKIIRITNINGTGVDLSDLKFFNIEDYSQNLDIYKISKGDILIAMSGATTGKIGYYTEDEVAYMNQRVGKIVPSKECLNNRFLYHFLLSKKEEIYQSAGGGAQPNLSSTKFMNETEIPFPPLEIQQEIVRILDNFTNLKAELQSELQARKEQYEYYKNKLFSFAPNEVEWKSMGEIGTFIRGNGLQKKDFINSGIGCIHYGQIYTYYGTVATNTKSFISQELASKLKKARHGDLIFTTTSENVEDVCKAVVWLGEKEIAIGGHSTIYRHKQNPKYLAYLSQTYLFLKIKKKVAIGAKVIDVSPSKMSDFLIPIPSLEKQQQIVSILEKFDILINDPKYGLPAEIEAIQQQYEYYREKLLTFERKA